MGCTEHDDETKCAASTSKCVWKNGKCKNDPVMIAVLIAFGVVFAAMVIYFFLKKDLFGPQRIRN